jgi:hypothetical protein
MKPYTLVGVDGNAFSIMAFVSRAMRRAGLSREEIDVYRAMATSDDYDHLLYVSIEAIEKVNDELRKKGLIDEDYENYEEDEY